jgi:hypothetical protein
MAYIDQTQTKKEIEDAIRGNSVSNVAPSKVSDDVQLVLNVNPKDYRRCNIVKGAIKSSTGNLTVYTIPADKDFFLTSISAGFIKDAANDMATGDIYFSCVIDGSITQLIRFPILTLTAQNAHTSLNLTTPIKIDRNSSIIISAVGGYTAGLMVRSCSITGYTVEP